MGMSIQEQEARARLQRGFESYLSGEAPPPVEMAQAPLLENWRVLILQATRGAEEFMLPVLIGSVTGHPQHDDVRTIRTSQLIWLDRNRLWARTWNRVYRLGKRETEIDGQGAGA